jgi:hypothetical protein
LVAYSTPITPLCADYDLWLGILNVVFALAVQRQELNLFIVFKKTLAI